MLRRKIARPRSPPGLRGLLVKPLDRERLHEVLDATLALPGNPLAA
jgi:hypothetical protein